MNENRPSTRVDPVEVWDFTGEPVEAAEVLPHGTQVYFTEGPFGAVADAQPPYPWCIGAPAKADCIAAGYCKRNPNCGE